MNSGFLGLALAVVSTAALADGPAMTVGSRQLKMSKAECITKATAVLLKGGLTTSFEVVGSNIFGEKGDYTGAIRCDENIPAVVFVVAGPESDQTIKIERDIEAAFSAP